MAFCMNCVMSVVRKEKLNNLVRCVKMLIWKSNLDSIGMSNVRGYLLKKAVTEAIFEFMFLFKGFKRDSTNRKYCAILQDNFTTKKYVLVAKSYIYGNIVSCHLRAVAVAMNTNSKLLMYIEQENNKFYCFNPEEIINENNHEINERVGEKMINFNIKLGEKYGDNSNI